MASSLRDRTDARKARHLTSFPRLTLFAAVALAVTVQFQTTISLGGADLRVSLSDVLALGLLPLAAALFVRHIKDIAAGFGSGLVALVVLASLVMAYGLVVGIVRLDGVQSWAMVKVVAWFALLYYGLLGVLLAHARPERAARYFAMAFVATLTLPLVVNFGFFIIGGEWIGSHGYRYAGFLDNPNAQGFSFFCGLAICLAAERRVRQWLGGLWAEALIGLMITGLVQTGSLAAFAAAMVALLAFVAIRRPKLAVMARMAVFAVGLVAAPLAMRAALSDTALRSAVSDLRDKAGLHQGLDPDAQNIRRTSIGVRIENYRRAIAEWAEAPIFGSGLGFHYPAGRALAGERWPAQQMHNTGLWILSEMGAVGLVVFIALFCALLWRFARAYRRLRDDNPEDADVLLATVLVVIGWLVMSQAHEFLYQRSLWIILGLGLGTTLRHAAFRHGMGREK